MVSVLKGGVTLAGEPVDIAIRNGKISDVVTGFTGEAQTVWQLNGRIVTPAFADAHVHLDKTLSLELSEVAQNASGTLLEAIERWQAAKPKLTRDHYYKRARQALELALTHGTTLMRTHVDIDAVAGLTALEALLELKAEFADRLTLELVALGHVDGGRQGELMAAALEAGAGYVGGAPALAPDPTETVRRTLDLAERYGRPIDLHIDETDDPTMATLETLAEETTARGLEGQVTAGHCVSLMAMSQKRASTIIDKVARARLNIISLPAVNLILQGRADTVAVRRGVTRIKELLAAGVNVSVASDNVRDPFNPFGNYDLLWLANLTGHVAHLTGTDERAQLWQLVSTNPARAMGVPYGLKAGCAADLVVLASKDAAGCLADLPARQAVFKAGRLIAGCLDGGEE
jgi:cytosine/creatinine deaminase